MSKNRTFCVTGTRISGLQDEKTSISLEDVCNQTDNVSFHLSYLSKSSEDVCNQTDVSKHRPFASTSSENVCNQTDHVSIHVTAQSTSLLDIHLQEPRTDNIFDTQSSSLREVENLNIKPVKLEIRNSIIETFLPHSEHKKVPVRTPKLLPCNLNASLADLSWYSDYSATNSLASPRSEDISFLNASLESGRNAPVLFSPDPQAARIPWNKTARDTFESFDVLGEAINIFLSLSVDISNSLDTIPKSIALPPVIEKYSGSNTASAVPPERVPKSSEKLEDSRPASLHEEYMEILAEFQIRCLEYREMIKDYAESILSECRRFTESSIPKMEAFRDSVECLKDNFSNFKTMCETRFQNMQSPDIVFANVFAIFMQTTFLHTLEQQNDCYLTRLQSGVHLVRAHCKLVQCVDKANLRIDTLLEEIHNVRRTTGYRV